MPTKLNGNIDWSKFFMGFAVAVVFVIQSLQGIDLNILEEEVETYHFTIQKKEELVKFLYDIQHRVEILEGANDANKTKR